MKKILIANRGEIAVRIIRSAKEMNISTVAVYSDADRKALHTLLADEAVHIGKSPSNESYLNINKIINAAKLTNADAIHPGYGFLSENYIFAEKVEKAGLIFIGPGSKAIKLMGNKLDAKKVVKAYNIPMVPGTELPVKNIKEALKIALEIGFPILVKAAAGGGGKGMRIVYEEKKLKEQLERAISEAKSAFGDGSVFIEKYISSPKHIEIQILADNHGNIIDLFERECSIQRRHQKVIEEAPSGIISAELRKKMGESAVKVARSCNYTGAGTVEFLMDENHNYYFLEMNTRLQVEHPVTELITGIDLVKEQFRIARGEKLKIKRESLQINGHAIEARIYAEDPANNFLPDTGKLNTYRPSDGFGVRTDSGYEEGMEVPVFYDPLIAKLIVHASDRKTAISKMIRAIDEFRIDGIQTTLPFCKFVCQHKAFVEGSFDTHFVDNEFKPDLLFGNKPAAMNIAALMTAYMEEERKNSVKSKIVSVNSNKSWKKKRKAIS